MPTPCFLITPTGDAQLSLRRYATDHCPTGGIHDAEVEIGTAPIVLTERGYLAALETPHDDPRWPLACACGHVFQEADPWQTRQKERYQAPDGQQYTTHRGDAPPGAMWHSPHMADAWTGPDGLCLYVVLPSGEQWGMDCPSTNGDGWTRTGTPPRITATPSIAASRYHGYLTDGVLTDDLEGRVY